MDKQDTIKWVVILIIIAIAAIGTPTLLPDLFKSCTNTFADIAKDAQEIGEGIQEDLPPAK